MVRAAALVLSLALAGSAQAQTTTECRDFMGTMTCKTRGGQSAGAAINWRDVPPKVCSRMERIAYSDSLVCEAREVAANRKAVGDLLAEGRCDDALKGALGTGDLQFASEVRAYCAK